MAGLALRPASGGIGGHPHRPRRGRDLAVCRAHAGAVGRSESLRPGSPRIPRLLGPGCHVVGHGATGRAGRTREGRRGRVAARDTLRPSALSERSASFVRNRGVPGGEVVLCFLGVLPGVVSSTLGWRSTPTPARWRARPRHVGQKPPGCSAVAGTPRSEPRCWPTSRRLRCSPRTRVASRLWR